MRRRLLLALLLVVLAAAAGAAALPAAAVTSLPPCEEGTEGHPFSFATPLPVGISVSAGSDQTLTLKRQTLTRFASDSAIWAGFPEGKVPDPRSVYPLPHGGFLVSGGKDAPFVKEVSAAGEVVWEYRNGEDGLLRKTWSAEPATFGGRPCVLISDRVACRVFAVDRATRQVVWQYGQIDTPGAGPDQLADPFCATQIPATAGQTNGNVLIADSQDNHRVIEVRSDDFTGPTAVDHGFSADSIVWQYGVTGQTGDHSGSDPGYLMFARSPQRLPNGDTLITDSANKRIIRVRSSDYDPTKPANGYTQDSIVWSYEDGVDGELLDPNTARLVTDQTKALSNTLIVTDCDLDAQRILFIDPDTKQVEETIDTRTLERPSWATSTTASSPRDARVDAEGALWVADAGFGQVLRLGYPTSVTAQSVQLGCGKPNMVKAFVRMKAFVGSLPSGTGFSLQFSVDGNAYRKPKPEGDGRNFDFSAGTAGKTFAYRLTLTTEDRWQTPAFDALTIHFVKATAAGTGGGGGGDGGSTDNGSGVVVYPTPAAVAAAPAAPTGGTGTYGSGTGSGTSGSGTGGAGAGTSPGAPSGTASGAGSSVSGLTPPVQSSGSGGPVEVEGYRTQGQEGVSGVPLSGAKGAQLPAPEPPGPPVPVAALILAAAIVLTAFFVPWPFVAARLRSITGFDHTGPARALPYHLLKK